MALREKKSKAIELRKQGWSYSQIKKELNVSKSSLSMWLKDMPLSEERIRELRDTSSIRIEHTRETKRKKKQDRLDGVQEKVNIDIGSLTEREMMIGGLFLYWGEGAKTTSACCTISNTDPAVILFFMSWLDLFDFPKDKLRVYLHLYDGMDIEAELNYWSKILDLPRSSFRNPYVKSSKRSDLTYKQRFTHGTCNLLCYNRDIIEYCMAGIEHIRSIFADPVRM